MRRPISAASSVGTTSSASTISTHSLRNGRLSSAQFFFFGYDPLKRNCTSVAPYSAATSAVSSVLRLSTTNTSSAQDRAGKQRRRFSPSFLTGTITLTGTAVRSGRTRLRDEPSMTAGASAFVDIINLIVVGEGRIARDVRGRERIDSK